MVADININIGSSSNIIMVGLSVSIRGAIVNIVPETLLSYMGDPLQNKQLYMPLQEYGLFCLQGN